MLNEYHLQFLHHLTDAGVRFLIIGGQARHLHYGNATHDLDLWVDIEPGSIPPLEKALVGWSKRYPQHWKDPLTLPMTIFPKKQLKFPDVECLFMTRAGEVREIIPAHGIDVLTSVEGHCFNVFYNRVFMHCVDGIDLAYLSKDDLPVISPVRVK
jgi:hypothetical protein